MKKTREQLSSDYWYRNCEELCKRLDGILPGHSSESAELYHRISQAVIAAKIMDIQETRHLEALLEDRERTLQDHFDRGLIPDWRPSRRRPKQ